MMKSKKLRALLLALVMVLSLAACGGKDSGGAAGSDSPAAPPENQPAGDAGSGQTDSDLAYVQGNGKMVIGYTVYEPMNYTDADGNFTGFDTELARAVCEKLGVEPEFQEIIWETKEVELAGKSIDCIWNGLTLDAEREANMNCTVPYVKNAQVVVVKSGTDYAGTSSLAGKTVVAEVGSAGEALRARRRPGPGGLCGQKRSDRLPDGGQGRHCRRRCSGPDPGERHDRRGHGLRRSGDCG